MKRFKAAAIVFVGLLTLMFGDVGDSVAKTGEISHLEGELPSGARYAIDMPQRWNNALLLYSHGYRPPGSANIVDTAPSGSGALLLNAGYALLGSSYRQQGWALQYAPDDQLEALTAFEQKFGRARRIIAWGESMGALVTLAIVEQHAERVDGAVAMCGSVIGSVGMLNQALDAGFVLKTLVDPNGDLALVGLEANNLPKVKVLVEKSAQTAQGQARLVFAGVLAQIPIGSEASEAHTIFEKTIMNGAFFPRADLEGRAHGNGSWNVGVDYATQLTASGHRDLVEAAYSAAGLSLAEDLQTLRAAPRIRADAEAVKFLKANYVPRGDLTRPVVTLHTTGDSMTLATYESAFRSYVVASGKEAFLRQAYVGRTGHCTYAASEAAAAALAVDNRVRTHHWSTLTSVASLNASAIELGEPAPQFVEFHPTPALRPCRGGTRCQGEP